jgi:DNA-binding transcriptional MerR regulator
MVTLGQAARLTGLNKSTLNRAIRSGRLSAARRDDGSYLIDPAELSRVYTIHVDRDAQGAPVAETDGVRQCAQGEAQPSSDARIAALEAQVAGLQALLAEVRSSRDEARARDHERHEQIRQLQEQNRMLLAALPPPPPPQRSWRWWWRT